MKLLLLLLLLLPVPLEGSNPLSLAMAPVSDVP
jgi:hypothetical protein